MTTHDNSQESDVFVAASGLKLRIKPVSRLLVGKAQATVKLPSVPKFFNEDKGREEENPNDPGYRMALMEALFERGQKVIEVCLAMGTELIECPSSLEPMESEGWISILEDLGISIGGNRGINSRYVNWLKYYAIPNEEELGQISKMALRSTLTLEADVENALVNFPGFTARISN